MKKIREMIEELLAFLWYLRIERQISKQISKGKVKLAPVRSSKE